MCVQETCGYGVRFLCENYVIRLVFNFNNCVKEKTNYTNYITVIIVSDNFQKDKTKPTA